MGPQESPFEMMEDVPLDERKKRLLVEAADWLVRLASGEATQADADELATWRSQSTDHDEAFRKVASIHMLTRAVAQEPAPVIDRRAVLTGGSVLAAVIGTFGIVRPPLSLWPSLAELMADHRTGAGERYTFSPVRGVEVELNSRTSVSLIGAGHGIALINGEAFIVAQSTRQPFIVEASGYDIAARSATFNIQSLGERLRVTCTQGMLECTRDGQRERIQAGEQLALAQSGEAIRIKVDPAKATAWRQGLLIFEGTPLADVVEQINLYRPGRIILTDGALGHRSVNGVFHTDRIENTVAQIQQALGLHVRHLPGGVLLLG